MNESDKKIKSIKFRKWKKVCLLNFTDGTSEEFSMDIVVEFALLKGTVINEDDFSKIKKLQRKINLKQRAYNYAAYKPRTVSQIKQKLRLLDYEEAEIDLAIEFLREFNMIDDTKFAENFIKDFIKLKPSGKKRIKDELFKRGIHSDIIDLTIEKYFPEESNLELAELAADKKMRALSHKTPEKQKSSLISYLQRQGFDWDTIKVILDKKLKQD